MQTFNPFGTKQATLSIIADLKSQVASGKSIALNKGGDVKPLSVGDGTSAIEIRLSVPASGSASGTRRGSSRLDLSGDQVGALNDVLSRFDPSEDLASLTPAECVSRTISVEEGRDGEDSVVSFKMSLEKNSRATKVPLSDWAEFVEFMSGVETWTHAAVDHFRNVIAAANEEAETTTPETTGVDGTVTPSESK